MSAPIHLDSVFYVQVCVRLRVSLLNVLNVRCERHKLNSRARSGGNLEADTIQIKPKLSIYWALFDIICVCVFFFSEIHINMKSTYY